MPEVEVEMWVCPRHGTLIEKGHENLIPLHRKYQRCYRVLQLEKIKVSVPSEEEMAELCYSAPEPGDD